MTRRDFIRASALATFGFSILPGAGRLWKPTGPLIICQEKLFHKWMNPDNPFYPELSKDWWIGGRAWKVGGDWKRIGWEGPEWSRQLWRHRGESSAKENFGKGCRIRWVRELPEWFKHDLERVLYAGSASTEPYTVLSFADDK